MDVTASRQQSKTQGKTDRSGYRYFSDTELGRAHALAHDALDAGQPAAGHRRLGAWLTGRKGRGSRFAHLHWHMAVFEIATGRVREAQARLLEHIVPAMDCGDALTDGPSLLWRLALSGRPPSELPWELTRRVALGVGLEDDPFVQLHALLAFSGAGDTRAVDNWLAKATTASVSVQRQVLIHIARGLRALIVGDNSTAANLLARYMPHAACLGGSGAQNQLFGEIAALAIRRARGPGAASRSRAA